MDLLAPLQRALREQNYTHPTPIQAKTIPAAIEGKDILGCAQTGTGKTAAFALPILDYLGHERPNATPNHPAVLVLAPTRELAIQIGQSFRTYGKHLKFRQTLVYGGVSQTSQVKDLRRGVHVLTATPGRLQDLMNQGHVSLDMIEIFVLDEADRMLDMGFLPSLKKIIAKVPEHKQSLFFSATLPSKIRELASQLLVNPVTVTVSANTPTVERINQFVRYAARGKKFAALTDILTGTEVDRTIVFTRTKHGANGLAKKLEREGLAVAVIHGNKTQNARQRALSAFRDNTAQVLVATDVAARGIDIDDITHVINYDMPVDPESYVHRIGRTGRAGADGVAISFCTPDELNELHAIEQMIGMKIPAQNPKQKFPGKQDPKNPTRNGGSRQKKRSGRRRNKVELREGAQNNYRRRKNSRHGENKTKNAKLNPRNS